MPMRRDELRASPRTMPPLLLAQHYFPVLSRRQGISRASPREASRMSQGGNTARLAGCRRGKSPLASLPR